MSSRFFEEMVKGWKYSLLVSGEFAIEDGDGWFGMRAKAYDSGRPEAILDCVVYETALGSVADPHVRAAVILKMFGFDEQDIGALLNSRRTGRDLVESGIREMTRFERMRKDACV